MNLILFGRWVLTTAWTRLPSLNTVGITNETDGGFLPFLDYDDIIYEKVVTDIRGIQREFSLDAAIILKTQEKQVNGETVGNYLVVWFDLVNHGLCREITQWARCDPRYRTYWKLLYQKNWVIRIGEKQNNDGGKIKISPSLKEVIYPTHRSQIHKKSRAYYLFFRKHFKIPAIRTNFTNDSDVALIPYLTTK